MTQKQKCLILVSLSLTFLRKIICHGSQISTENLQYFELNIGEMLINNISHEIGNCKSIKLYLDYDVTFSDVTSVVVSFFQIS